MPPNNKEIVRIDNHGAPRYAYDLDAVAKNTPSSVRHGAIPLAISSNNPGLGHHLSRVWDRGDINLLSKMHQSTEGLFRRLYHSASGEPHYDTGSHTAVVGPAAHVKDSDGVERRVLPEYRQTPILNAKVMADSNWPNLRALGESLIGPLPEGIRSYSAGKKLYKDVVPLYTPEEREHFRVKRSIGKSVRSTIRPMVDLFPMGAGFGLGAAVGPHLADAEFRPADPLETGAYLGSSLLGGAAGLVGAGLGMRALRAIKDRMAHPELRDAPASKVSINVDGHQPEPTVESRPIAKTASLVSRVFLSQISK